MARPTPTASRQSSRSPAPSQRRASPPLMMAGGARRGGGGGGGRRFRTLREAGSHPQGAGPGQKSLAGGHFFLAFRFKKRISPLQSIMTGRAAPARRPHRKGGGWG